MAGHVLRVLCDMMRGLRRGALSRCGDCQFFLGSLLLLHRICPAGCHHIPTNNSAMQNGSSVGMVCVHIACTFGTDLYAQSVLINKISASELSREVY